MTKKSNDTINDKGFWAEAQRAVAAKKARESKNASKGSKKK